MKELHQAFEAESQKPGKAFHELVRHRRSSCYRSGHNLQRPCLQSTSQLTMIRPPWEKAVAWTPHAGYTVDRYSHYSALSGDLKN
jgi:hypothetical protein